MNAAPSRAPANAGQESSSWPQAEQSSWMKSVNGRSQTKANSCGLLKRRLLTGLEAVDQCRLTCAWSRQQTKISDARWTKENFVAIYFFVWPSSRSRSRRWANVAKLWSSSHVH